MLKAATMNPRYIALETSILAKAREIVTSLIPSTPNAGDQLKKVAEILEKLREVSIPTMAKEGTDDGRVVVQILNTIDLVRDSPDPIPVVAISGSSAEQR